MKHSSASRRAQTPARKGWSLAARFRPALAAPGLSLTTMNAARITGMPGGFAGRQGGYGPPTLRRRPRQHNERTILLATLLLTLCALVAGVCVMSIDKGRAPAPAPQGVEPLGVVQKPDVSLDGVAIQPDAFNKAEESLRDSVTSKQKGRAMEQALANPRSPGSKGPQQPFGAAAGSTAVLPTPTSQDVRANVVSPNNNTSADTYEPDDTILQNLNNANDTSLALSTSYTHTLAPNTSDVDFVRFDITLQQNETYTLYTNNLETGVDTYLTLYDSSGNVLATNNNDPTVSGTLASRITFNPTSTSTAQRFFAQVSSNSSNSNALPGQYTIRLDLQALNPTTTPISPTSSINICYDAFEPDSTPDRARLLRVSSQVGPQFSDTPQTGNAPLPTQPPVGVLQNDGASQFHVICPQNDVDWVYFDLVRGKQYSIMASNLGGGLDSFMVLYRLEPDGSLTPLYASDDAPGFGLASRIDFTAPLLKSNPTGTFQRYYLATKDVANHGRKDMSYWLTLSTLGDAQGTCLDSYEPDNQPFDAHEILLNETQAHTFCMDKDVDWLKFYAKANQTYAIDTLALSPVGVDDNLTVAYVAFDPTSGAQTAKIDLETVDDLPDGSVMGRLYFRPDQYAAAASAYGIPDIGNSGYYYVAIRNVGDIGRPGLAYQVRFSVATGVQLGEAPAFIGTARASTSQTITAQTAIAAGSLPPAVTPEPTTPPTSGTPNSAQQTVNAYNTQVAATLTASSTDPVVQTAVAATLTAGATPHQITGSNQVTPGVGATSAGIVRAGQFADAAFQSVWSRADQPVVAGDAGRSWLWGAQPGAAQMEAYAEASDGTRQVQYFDKARMEINQPKADRSSAWFVTNGLLVREMVSGKLALGDTTSQTRNPATIPVAGDPLNNVAPAYAAFRSVISIDGSNRADDHSASPSPVTTSMSADGHTGTIADVPGDSAKVLTATYINDTGHNIPAIFWDFMHREGPISVNGQTVNGPLMDWLSVMGLPISEPYWIRATVGGVEKDVLVQLFERRSLTYTPTNAAAWQVEMGNVGQHYYQWRYGRAWPNP